MTRSINTDSALLRVVAVKPLENCAVQLRLTDGSTRVVNLRPWLKGPAFRPLLRDISLFRKVGVEHGTLHWPTGQALCPDVLLDTGISRTIARRGRRTMAAICQFDSMIIYVCPEDHSPPHVHVMHKSTEALLNIDDGKVTRGKLPQAALKPLREWLKLRRAEVALEWVRAQGGKQPRPVAPLVFRERR